MLGQMPGGGESELRRIVHQKFLLGHPSEEVAYVSDDINPAADCQDVGVLGQQGRVDNPPLVLRLLEVRVW